MRFPFVIDNQDHRLADTLSELRARVSWGLGCPEPFSSDSIGPDTGGPEPRRSPLGAMDAQGDAAVTCIGVHTSTSLSFGYESRTAKQDVHRCA
jgi:hypothetical protein